MKEDTRSFYTEAIRRVIEHIASSLDAALDLDTLAETARLSPFHFHRVFRGMVGETPIEFGRRLRLERAAWQLTSTTRAVTEIAFEAGYETHEAFTRAFRAAYSTSPTGFRQLGTSRYELAAASGVHFDSRGTSPLFVPRDTGGRSMQVEIAEHPGLRVGTVRHVGPYNRINEAFERLGALAGRAGLWAQPQPVVLALYHDDPEGTAPEALRSDAAISVPLERPMPEGLVEQHIPAGTYASTLHVGPYERLGDAWARFMGEWLPASGRRLGDGPSFEVYLNMPGEVPPEELRTLLYVSLA